MKYTSLEVDDPLDTIPENAAVQTPEQDAATTRRHERLLILASMAGFFMMVAALSLHNPEITNIAGDSQALRGGGWNATTTSTTEMDIPAVPADESSRNSLLDKSHYVMDPCTVLGDCDNVVQEPVMENKQEEEEYGVLDSPNDQDVAGEWDATEYYNDPSSLDTMAVSEEIEEAAAEEETSQEDLTQEEWETTMQEAARAEDPATVARIEDEDNHGH